MWLFLVGGVVFSNSNEIEEVGNLVQEKTSTWEGRRKGYSAAFSWRLKCANAHGSAHVNTAFCGGWHGWRVVSQSVATLQQQGMQRERERESRKCVFYCIT